MVGKCANPDCGVPFLYFREGRLFRFEVGSTAAAVTGEPGDTRRRIEHFWLCGSCARAMTLVCERGETVRTMALRRPVVSTLVPLEKARAQQSGA